MSLNVAKGNMYGDITHTWNTVKGKCEHDCGYCYMKRFGEQKPRRFDVLELAVDLGENNRIFVGSSNDMWSKTIENKSIISTLVKCMIHPNNKYRFQTKNPIRYQEFIKTLNYIDCELGTTIETNRVVRSHAPHPYDRALAMKWLKEYTPNIKKTFITIEPIHDFSLYPFVSMLEDAKPDVIYIGADTNNKIDHDEPDVDKIIKLKIELSKFTEVKLKPNLRRLGVMV